jgi:hypothetical protein
VEELKSFTLLRSSFSVVEAFTAGKALQQISLCTKHSCRMDPKNIFCIELSFIFLYSAMLKLIEYILFKYRIRSMCICCCKCSEVEVKDRSPPPFLSKNELLLGKETYFMFAQLSKRNSMIQIIEDNENTGLRFHSISEFCIPRTFYGASLVGERNAEP